MTSVQPARRALQRAPLTLAITTLLLACTCANAAALDDVASNGARGDTTTHLDTVVVTGSRASGRTVGNSAAPIDVIGTAEIESTGASSLLEALNRLLPSFNLPAALQPDLGSIARGGQLRNLDPAYTLTLINGKRRNTTALVNEDGFAGSVAVDLALIPTGAIERIEVLRDGASALYGSSAIAGVINVVLKGDTDGSASLRSGQSYRGDGAISSAAIDKGFALGDRGVLHLSAQLDQQDSAVRNPPLKPGYLLYPAVDANGNPVRLGSNNALPAGAQPNPKEAGRDNRPWRNSGQIEFTTSAASFNGNYRLLDNLELYGFGNYAHRRAYSAQNFRPAYTVWLNNPALLALYPDGFTPYQSTSEDQYQLVAGLRGEFGEWHWDLSSNYGEDSIDAYVRNSANYKLSYPGARTNFYVGQRSYSAWTNNLDVTRSFTDTVRYPLDVSFGLEQQRERAELRAGEPDSWYGGYGGGSVSLTGYFPQDASRSRRDSIAAYVGLATQFNERWFVDTALRAEHYSDFGSSGLTGKLSTRYAFSPLLAVRATVSNGFHAPALVTTSYSNTSDRPNGVQSRLVRAGSAEARALGGAALRPEKARNLSLGFTGTIGGNVNWALDAYQIDVDHLLGTSSNIGIDWTAGYPVDASGTRLSAAQVAIIEGLLAPVGVAPGTSINVHYFTEVGDIRSRGVDLTFDGQHALGPGRLRWNIAANFNRTSLTRIADIPAQLQGLPNIATLSTAAQNNLKYRAPRDRQIVGVNYRVGAFSIDLRESRIGALRRFHTLNGGGSYDLDPTYSTDLALGWSFQRGLELTLGANNLFDAQPQKVPDFARTAANLAQYTYQWDNSGPLGNIGGSYYLRADYRF